VALGFGAPRVALGSEREGRFLFCSPSGGSIILLTNAVPHCFNNVQRLTIFEQCLDILSKRVQVTITRHQLQHTGRS
jgi:hypothetical protein